MIFEKPKLVTFEKTKDKLPSVLVGICACGHTYFPPHLYGCESCGGGPELLKITELPAKGKLLAYAAAHQHIRPDGEKPLFIGEITLENGPDITAGLDVKNENEIENCEKVVGRLIEIGKNENGEEIVDLFFMPAGGEK